MTKRKVTPWFPHYVSPVHIGMYQRDWGIWADDLQSRDYWDGNQWFLCADGTPNNAMPSTQKVRWRGLTEPADAAQ